MKKYIYLIICFNCYLVLLYGFQCMYIYRYGNCFRTNIFGETHVFVSSTESAKAILNNDSGKFTKRYIKSIAELVGYQSLLCASHQHHKLIRSRLSNLFTSGSQSLFLKQFDELVVENLRSWEHRPTVVVLDEAFKVYEHCYLPIFIIIYVSKIRNLIQYTP